MITREEVRAALTGPITSTHVPFNQDGSIDFAGLRNHVEHNIQAGSKTILLTYGDSLYSILTDAEVAEVTKVVAEQTARRAMVVAADRIWWTGKEIAFAQYARDVGADMLMVLPPAGAPACTAETFVAHYTAVAEHIPVMVVTNVFSASRDMGLEVMKTLSETVENIMAVKDDLVGEFARKMSLLVHERWAVLSGGQKTNHLDLLPYGCDSYMSTFMQFKPSVTADYWQAIQAQNWTRAKEVIRDYDIPYFNFVLSLPGGFDAGIHGTYEIFGIAKRWRRKPYYSLSDADMERLADHFNKMGLL
ncbi:MAG: dihydrodipicolinate synthase family protein [Chloroflexi bacterium]|nr:dihydrodipicolinate synthase family protein [Chloroflexota bacterium]